MKGICWFFFSFFSLFYNIVVAQLQPLSPYLKFKENYQQKATGPNLQLRVTSADTTGFGGEPGVVWERDIADLFKGIRKTFLTRQIELADGSFIAFGNGSDSANSMRILIQYNSAGQVLYKDHWIDVDYSYSDFVFPASDSGWYSTIRQPYQGKVYNAVRKYNKDGSTRWLFLYDSTYSCENTSVVSTSDGGCLIAYLRSDNTKQQVCSSGNVTLYGVGCYDRINLIKVGRNGMVQWEKEIFNQDYYRFGSYFGMWLVPTKGGFFFVSEYTKQQKDSTACWNYYADKNIFVGKINENGDSLLTKLFGGGGNEGIGQVVTSKQDSGIVIYGYSGSVDGNLTGLRTDVNGVDSWVLKLNDNATIVKNKVYQLGTAVQNALYSGIELKDSGFILSGVYYSGNEQGNFLVRMDKEGSVLWQKKDPADYVYGRIHGDGNQIYYIKNFAVSEDRGYFGKLGPSSFITGSVFYDLNKNGIKDANEVFCKACIVTSSAAGFSRSSSAGNGWYRNDVQPGAYTTSVTVSNNNYAVVPVSHSSTLNNFFEGDSVHFALQPLINKKDLSLTLMPVGAARPGFPVQYKLRLKNEGTVIVPSSSVVLIKDSKTSYVSSVPAISAISGDTLKWNYSDFQLESDSAITINLLVNSPPGSSVGDTLKLVSHIASNAGDVNMANDTATIRQLVVGSYDPNDKSENFVGRLPVEKVVSGEYMYYLIRFQNTGTDTAFTVFITDTLDAGLDWNSFQMVGASHPYQLTIQDQNKVKWFFPGIHLVDSNKNETLSHGYVYFKIRPKQMLQPGDFVKNKAHIYFDYNLPVITNQITTTVSSRVVTGATDLPKEEMGIILSPNPSPGLVNISIKKPVRGKIELRVFDQNGKIVSSQKGEVAYTSETYIFQLNLFGIRPGVYVIYLSQKGKNQVQKLVIQ